MISTMPSSFDQVIEPPQEARAGLALGAAVDLDQHGPAAGETAGGGAIDERGDLAGRRRSGSGSSVGLGERRGVQPAGLALGPAQARGGRLLVEVQRVGVGRRPGPSCG